jgi:molybdate transport system permease protein
VRITSFGAWLAAATVLTLVFLAVPMVAIFAELTWQEFVDGVTSEVARDALRVTAETNLVALALIVLFGTPTAYLLATRRFRGRAVLVTLVELPLVLPPAVAGLGLLAAFGRFELLGRAFDTVGVEIAFTKIAVVLAVTFVASPFYVRTAIAAFEAVDQDLVAASRTLGAGPARTFARVALPLASGGLGAGAALAFARGLGEFGATIMFAGSLQGVTQTLSLAVYQEFDVRVENALAIGALLVVISALVLFVAKLVPAWRRSVSTSTTVSVPSVSS